MLLMAPDECGIRAANSKDCGKGRSYPDSWNATAKTRVHILKLDDQMGGRVEISCEGPLTGVVEQNPVNADWSGQIWGEISGLISFGPK